MISRLVHFVRAGIWELRLADLPPLQVAVIRSLRVLLLTVRGFYEDRCPLRAAALTYYSLLSIVPLAALVFGIAKGFGLQEYIESQILQMAQRGHWEGDVAGRVIAFSYSLLENTKGGLIAGIGVVLLFWAVLSILGEIEDAFNCVWRVRRSRRLARKFTDYLAMMVSAPILFVLSSSLTVLVTGKAEAMIQRTSFLGPLGPAISFLLTFLPYVSIWTLLVLHYVVMPNTRVPIRSGVVAAVITGTIYQVLQWVYIKFQVGVAHYGAIYGSFAALPLFMVWVQLSWMMVLFGAEISFAHGNCETFGFHPDDSRVSISARKLLALRICHLLIKRFSLAEKPLNAREISETLEIPGRLSRQLLHELAAIGLVTETMKSGKNEVTFQPGRDVSRLTIQEALGLYEESGTANIPIPDSEEATKLLSSLKRLSDLAKRAPENVVLKEI